MNNSITSARSFIENSIAGDGLSYQDVMLEYPAVLSFRYLWRRIKEQTGLLEFSHRVVKDAYIHHDTLFIESRISSPAMAIQAETLLALGVSKIAYIGIAGSISPELDIGDLVVSTGAINETGTGVCYGHDFQSVIPADGRFAGQLNDRLREQGLEPRLAVHWCTDAPYRETRDKVREYRKRGAACVEMEGAGLFAVAREHGIPAAAAFVISDQLQETGWVQGWEDPRFKQTMAKLAGAMVHLSRDL
jgi:uridine phosphorylase